MAGFDNEVVYSLGNRLELSTAQSIYLMQQQPTDVSIINYTGNPNTFVSANPSSICHDASTGDIWIKASGTGNTGWQLLIGASSLTITGTSGGALSPDGAGNWSLLGNSTASGTVPVSTTGVGSTLTFSVQKAQAVSSSNPAMVGLSSFKSTDFTVDANGFVSLVGGGASPLTITGTTGGAISPNGAGNWGLVGTSTASGTNPVSTAGAGNNLTVQVQKASAVSSSSATRVGLASFKSTDFTVDVNGFVSLQSPSLFVNSVSGTVNRITSTGGANPIIDIANTYIGQTSITTLGTVTTGIWNANIINVPYGGTGRSSHTAYAVICGGTTTTAAQQSIASVGTAGQVLTSNGAGALPTMQNGATGNVMGSGSSTDNALARWNGTGGDTLQDSTVIVTDAGELTNASQPAFGAYLPTDDLNVTGNGAIYRLGSKNTLTEVYDRNNDFNTNGTFTAPVTGVYFLGAHYRFSTTTPSKHGSVSIITSNNSYGGIDAWNATSVESLDSGFKPNASVIANMDVGDTATFSAEVDGKAGNTMTAVANSTSGCFCYGILLS